MKAFIIIAALAGFQLGMAQKTMEIKGFSELAVSGGVDIKLVASGENKLVIEQGDPDKLQVASDEGVLAISNNSNEDFEITIYFNGQISEIAASGGVEIHSKGKIKAKNLTVNIAGGSEIHLDVEAETVTTAAAGGAEIHFSGTAAKFEAAVASGAELGANGLKTENNSTVVASGGEAVIYATGIVNATVASGGELTIHGNPKKVNQVKADGGEIKIVK